MTEGIWDQDYSVRLAAGDGWSPQTWGTIAVSSKKRRNTIGEETTDPFIVVLYVRKDAEYADEGQEGRFVGFYLVSHEKGHRNRFTHSSEHGIFPDKWQYGFRALRAFRFLDEFRPDLADLDLAGRGKARAFSQHILEASPAAVRRLVRIPFVEEPVFGSTSEIDPVIHYSRASSETDPEEQEAVEGIAAFKGKVGAGGVNRSGYFVPAEPVDAPKELYVLRLDGDVNAWLETPTKGRSIYKIGYSISPATRCDAFQRALPWGRYGWHVERSTRGDGDDRYPGSDIAIAGEDAMKDFLANKAEWLGGEFYAATEDQIEKAWKRGRKAARKRMKDDDA